MAALSKILRSLSGGQVAFHCPGCSYMHAVGVEAPATRVWGWNRDVERPTFSPSILVRTGRAVDPTFEPEPGDPPEVCHSFVRDGQIQFLTDSTHALAGQTVPIPDWPAPKDL